MHRYGWLPFPAEADIPRVIITALLALACGLGAGDSAFAGGNASLTIDLDGDGIADPATVGQDGSRLQISFHSSRSGQTGSVSLEVDTSCGPSHVFATRKPAEVAVDSSCTGQGAQVSTRLYRTDGPVGKWCLEREVTGERASLYETPYPRYSVVRHACGRAAVNLVGRMRAALASPNDRNALIQQFDEFDAAEVAGLVDAGNVALLNDLGYYLERAQNATAAAIVLAAVRQQAPQRVVAILNMADALWALQAQGQARQLYQEYDQRMRANGLARQVPTRVGERK